MSTQDKTPGKWSDYLPYLKGDMLQGKSYTLTIQALRNVTMYPQGHKTEQPVLYFSETGKGLVLNQTLIGKLGELFGDEIGNCIGKKVVLWAETRNIGGRVVEVINLRATDKEST